MNRKKTLQFIGILSALSIMVINPQTASARILFEDDAYFNINSEGAILDANNNAGTNTINLQFGNDGTDANVEYDPVTGNITLSTPGGSFSFSDDNLTTTGAAFFQNTSEFHLRQVADEAAASCSTVDEVVLDTTENTIYICTVTGNPGTWVNAASAVMTDLQGAYDADGPGAHEIIVSAGDGEAVEIRANANGDDLLQLENSTATPLINFQDLNGDTIDIDSLGVDWSATGAFTLNSTGNITIGAGNDIIFDDAQLTGTVQLSDADTDWAGTFSTDGVVDNINSFTSTSNGEGASNVGFEDASNWFTGTEIEAALNEIEALFGSTTSSIFDFTENNVLVDNDPVYTGLNRLDLKWGDLASIVNGEGASLVGIEDAGGYFSGSDVESALQELGVSNSLNFANLTFYPEYPDTVIYPDGSDNQGTLQSLYDNVQQTGYYDWTTNALLGTQDIDIRFSFALPNDFSSTGDFSFEYRTGTTTEANNDVEVRLYNVTDSQECANDLTNGTANTWATGTIASASIETGCTGVTALNAGDIVEVQIKLLDQLGASDFADAGKLIWNYLK